MKAARDLVHDLAEAAAGARYADLPEEAVDAAKKSVLDTLGVTLAAGGVEPAVRNIMAYVLDAGGRAESSVLGTDAQVPAAMAAFANGAMAHSLDFDDRTPQGNHSGSCIIPAVLALAERRGGITGQELIAAIAVGQDLFVRLRQNVGWRQDWQLTTVLGVYGAAAAAARVLQLGPRPMANALGIASLHSCGTMELVYGVGSDLRGMYAGFVAKGAVLSALLAERGVTGIETLFEGPAGVFRTYFGGHYDRGEFLEGLGRRYLGPAVQYKPWPTVGLGHPYIHALRRLMREHGVAASDIEQIVVHVEEGSRRMCEPLAARRAPATRVDARLSLPFCLALVAVHGDIDIASFSAAALRDREVLAMARKVFPVEDHSGDWTTTVPPGRVRLVLRDGRAYEVTGDRVPGSPEAPLSWDDLVRKFRGCVAVAARPPTVDRCDEAIALIRDLEAVDDATRVIELLA